jgi:hypothetical protein
LAGKVPEETAYRQSEKLVRLIRTLKDQGYRSQYELSPDFRTRQLAGLDVPANEIVVGMGRNGDFMRLMGGRHRISIAQQIGIEEVPAILMLVHHQSAGQLPEKRRVITGSPEDFRPF